MKSPAPALSKAPPPALKSNPVTSIRIGHGDFPNAVLQGTTPHFKVYADPGLGTDGMTIAKGVLGLCERDYTTIKGYFGGINPPYLPFNVIIADLTHSKVGACGGTAPVGGGAYHCGCDGIHIYCDVKRTPSPDARATEFLNVAEVVEVFESVQNQGWNCSSSNGEGLSRVLATTLYPDQLDGYDSAHAWLDGGRPDCVNRTNPSDTLDVSNGCSVLFLNYLRYQLGHPWNMIVQAAAPTLAGTYLKLTHDKRDPFPTFKALLDLTYPSVPSGLTTDNPWPLEVAYVTYDSDCALTEGRE
jgi:hypothetical protein